MTAGEQAGPPRTGSPSPRAGEGDGRAIAPWLRRLALGVVVGRFLIVLGVIPAIPLLIVQERYALLVLLRPTKEWLLLGGAVLRVQGEPSVWLLLAAYTPLMIVVVWAFFLAGRAYQDALRDGTGPRWLHRLLPPDKLELAQRMLVRRGALIAVLGRLAAMPPTLLAAAAGVSDIRPRRYLGADLLGSLLAFGAVVGAGYGLGEAYERGGVWLTTAGIGLFVLLVLLMTRWIRREAARTPAEASSPDGPRAPSGH
jgi:membrane protein DedA with SNARE-associated domain